jgi:hypothetical protein
MPSFCMACSAPIVDGVTCGTTCAQAQPLRSPEHGELEYLLAAAWLLEQERPEFNWDQNNHPSRHARS